MIIAMMTIEDTKNTIYTRLKVAEKSGNEAEKSLLYNIYLYMEELQQRREKEEIEKKKKGD
jgi:hypothetical protein